MSEGGEGPKFQQARKPEETVMKDDRLPTLRSTLIGGALLGGAIATLAAGSNALEQNTNKDQKSYNSLIREKIRFDTSRLKIVGDEVRIRSDAFKPIPRDIQEDKDNIIDNIKTINGVEWDGKSDFEISNVPYVMSEDPTNRMQKGAWMILEVETDNGSHELGYISNSGATRSIIETVTKGEIGEIKINANKQLEGKLESGKTFTEGEIGKVEIVVPQSKP